MAKARPVFIRRLPSLLSRGLAWPFRTFLRITKDGLLFTLLAVACAIVAFRADALANIPLLICLVLFSLIASSLVLGGASLRHLRLIRHCPTRTFAGEPVTVGLTVKNTARLPAAGLVLSESLRPLTQARRGAASGSHSGGASSQESQRLLPPMPGAVRLVGASGGQTFAMTVPGRGQERTRYQLMIRRRGIYEFGRTRLSTVFPFGFWRSQVQRRTAGRLAVYPRLGEIDAALFQELELALQRIRHSRRSREEHDFRSLRDYRHGDNPKWIHWRSSAHHGKLLIREFEEPQAKRVFILLDTNLRRLGAQRRPAFELAISFAATAARELVRRNCQVSVFLLPPGAVPPALRVSREKRNLDRLFEALAGLRADNTRTLAGLKPFIRREQLRQVYVLVLGMGSLRVRADLTWLASFDNIVKVLDVRGEEFRRLFRRTASGAATRDELDEDLLLALGDDELDELAQEELALVG